MRCNYLAAVTRASLNYAAACHHAMLYQHLHILHKTEITNCSSAAVPVSVLAPMKSTGSLNLPAQGAGPVMSEQRLNQLWLIVGRGCWGAVGVSLICI